MNMKRTQRPALWVLWACGVVLSTAALTPSPQAPPSRYFVALYGNDAGNGTETAPWRTIQRCVSQAAPGDTCVIGPGRFAEAVVISRSGSAGHPLRVVGQDGGASVIEGTIAVSGDHVDVENIGVYMPPGATWGLRMTGHAGVARNIHVTTESASLGANNAAASISGSNNTLTRSRLEQTCFGITLGGTANLISHNELTGLWPNGGRCGDIDYVRVFGSDHALRNNVLHGIDRSRTGSAHVDCFQTFDNNGPDRAVRNLVIDGNFCSDASQGVLFQARVHRQSRDVVISNNVFTRVAAWCALLEDIDGVRILNNTCDTSTAHHGMWCRSNSHVGSCEFKNNIFYGRGTAYGVMGNARLIEGSAAAPGKNNLLFATEGPGAFKGYAADRLNTDPGFVDRAAGNYRLLASSPARDAGVPVDGWQGPVDYDGIARPQGAGWDIGAYEFTDTRPSAPGGLRIIPENPPTLR
jgi:hypothetical protein